MGYNPTVGLVGKREERAHAMGTLRISLCSLLLTLSNLIGILAGFIAYRAIGEVNQLAVQLPLAVTCSIVIFALWCRLSHTAPFHRLALGSRREFAYVFLASLAWNPVVFVPLHYITQGYLTSAGNIVALLFFQVPVNALAVTLSSSQPGYRADPVNAVMPHAEKGDVGKVGVLSDQE